MSTDFRLILSDGVDSLTFNGQHTPSDDGLIVVKDKIEGLWSAPANKTSLTERQTGDGAHNVNRMRILYSARTVTIPFGISVTSHTQRQNVVNRLNSMTHNKLLLEIIDGEQRTYLQGFIEPKYSDLWAEKTDRGTITMVCPDPYRYSMNESTVTLTPVSKSGGGLVYASGGLRYPLNYGDWETNVQNMAILTNNGSTTAYPIIEAYNFNNGISFEWQDSNGSHQLSYDGWIGNVPAVFDCSTNTVSVGGTDSSRSLRLRAFPSIPPQASIIIILSATGSGWVNVKTRDTYI